MGARMPDVLKSILLFKSYLSVGDKNRLPSIWSLDNDVLKAFNYLALKLLYIATYLLMYILISEKSLNMKKY